MAFEVAFEVTTEEGKCVTLTGKCDEEIGGGGDEVRFERTDAVETGELGGDDAILT